MLVAALALLALATAQARAATFTRGFVDDVWFDGTQAGVTTPTWLANTRASGARFVQIEVDWWTVEPSAPAPGTNPTNPAGPQFNFSYLDQRVEEITSAGLTPVFLVTAAPSWAEASGGSATLEATGGYRPNAKAFGELGQALATRYSGHYPNPAALGTVLPRVRYMQAWGEANMTNHLSPQWVRVHGRAVNTGAIIYRSMLNDFYAGVKAGDRSDVVLMTGLEGYGDAPFTGLERTHPVTFLENLLCLSPQLRRVRCAGGGAHFNVLASDPYEAFSPTTPAVSPLDASAPDLARLTRVLNAGLAAHTVLPHTQKPLWVTEFSYQSDPPIHVSGTPSLATQARWLEQSFYVFWHEGVSTVLWYLLRDQAPPYTINYASGVYYYNGKPKPSLVAYRFPLVVSTDGRGRSQLWGIAPTSGTVRVQVQRHGWRTVATFHRRAGAVFSLVSDKLAHGRYRATDGSQKSLVWVY
ncbi:hypothetical protein [Conexibacter sp. S30A1]|uniref:hypothetical protein n=1 Tax=Conexibacter sp. S30A1 TaxID=2937800 RepID=UPI00200DC2C5|nr:hypothetical protein [Conexibacter sp. S30A1]